MADPTWRRYLRFWRSSVEADVDDELRFHFEERIEALVAAGLTRDEARRAAEAEFGDIAETRRDLRAIGRRLQSGRTRLDRWEGWRHDVTYAARSLRRVPGVSVTIVLTLALGIGVNATLFSLLDRVFLRQPAGIAHPEQLRRLFWTGQGMKSEPMAIPHFSIPLFSAVADAVRETASVTVYRVDRRKFGDETERKTLVTAAGAGYFALLGVRPAFGRFFTADEEHNEVAVPVAVVAESFWRRRYGGSAADAVGQTIVLDRRRLTVVGVAPRDFTGPDLDATDVWVPLGMLGAFGNYDSPGVKWYASRRLYAFQVLAQPRAPGIDRLEAAATVGVRRGFAGDNRRQQSLALTGPLLASRGPETMLQEASIAIRLGGVALIVLLIACANVANLLLARSAQRRREIAVRSALGIARSGIVRLFLAESVLLALAAGAAAFVVSAWAGALLRTLLFPTAHWTTSVADWRVAAFTLVTTLAAGLAAGLVPAIRSSRVDVSQTLKSGGREGSVQGSRLRLALVVGQAALSTMLLVGAALFLKSLHAVRALDLGFDVQRLVFVTPSFDGGERSGSDAADAAALPELASRLARVPGVERVALSSMSPMYGFSFSSVYYASGDTLPTWSDGAPGVTGVSPAFFATTGLRVLRGRGFAESDRHAGGVIVVNQTLARAAWPHGDALGQCLRLDKRSEPCLTIVGVVEDSRRSQVLEEPVRQLYVPAPPKGSYAAGTVIVRVPPARAGAVEAAARREVPALFPGAEAGVLRMAEILAPQYRPWELGATLFGILGLLALVVAAIGVFSTLSNDIGQRRHELGVRVALGASVRDIVALVLGSGVRVVVLGAVLGSLLAVAAGRLVSSLLYGVAPRDPGALAGVGVLLLVVAVIASAVPAWRASRADPMVALRAD